MKIILILGRIGLILLCIYIVFIIFRTIYRALCRALYFFEFNFLSNVLHCVSIFFFTIFFGAFIEFAESCLPDDKVVFAIIGYWFICILLKYLIPIILNIILFLEDTLDDIISKLTNTIIIK